MPAPPAKSATRAVAVLSYLTANPRGSFTLSELARALRVSLASLSPVLEALTEAGYVIRHPRHKTYELGPALVAVGQAASLRHPVVELARAEMRALVQDTGGECIGSAVLGGEILILAMEGRPSAMTRGVALGQRIPLTPPFGQVFLAWSPAPVVEQWLTRNFGAALSADNRAHLLRALDRVRRRGYAITLRTDRVTAFNRVLGEWARSPVSEELRQSVVDAMRAVGDSYEVLNESPAANYDVVQLIAPIFGEDGHVVFALTLLGLDGVSGEQVLRTARKVTTSAMHLSRRIGGRPPVFAASEADEAVPAPSPDDDLGFRRS